MIRIAAAISIWSGRIFGPTSWPQLSKSCRSSSHNFVQFFWNKKTSTFFPHQLFFTTQIGFDFHSSFCISACLMKFWVLLFRCCWFAGRSVTSRLNLEPTGCHSELNCASNSPFSCWQPPKTLPEQNLDSWALSRWIWVGSLVVSCHSGCTTSCLHLCTLTRKGARWSPLNSNLGISAYSFESFSNYARPFVL